MNRMVMSPTLALMLVSSSALAAISQSATRATSPQSAPTGIASSVPATDERSIMSRLSPKGFIDFNDYRHEPNGSAVVQAINGDSGKLETITVDPSGKVSQQTGWQLTQPAGGNTG